MSDEPVQLFVRNDKGATFGPLSPQTIELLLDNGVIAGRVQLSLDGLNYVFPGRLPGLRMVVPRQLWGDVVEPGDELDAQWAKVVLPASTSVEPTPSTPSGIVRGAVPGGPVAGPGARAQSQQRSTNGANAATPRAAHAPPVPSFSSPSRASLVDPKPVVTTPDRAAPPQAPAAVPGPPVRAQATASSVPGPPVQATVAPAAVPRTAVQPNPPTLGPEPKTDPSRAIALGAAPAPASVAMVAPTVVTDDIAASGTLAEASPLRLYFLAAAADRTGLLTIKTSDRIIMVHFRKGAPEFVDSSHPEDGLSAFLVTKQLIGTEALASAEAQKARFGGELLPALFAMGLLNPNTTFQHLGQRASDLLSRALVAEAGSFLWHVEDLSPSKAVPLGNKWSIFFETLRRVPAAEVRRRMQSALDLPVMKGQGPVALTELKLSPHESRALNYFDGVRSLNQLMSQVPAEADVIVRTAWVLESCGIVSFGTTVLKNETPSQKPAPLPPRAAPQPPGAAAARALPKPPVLSSTGPTPAPQGAPGGAAVPFASSPSQVPGGPPKLSASPSTIAKTANVVAYSSRPSQIAAAAKTNEEQHLLETLEKMRGQNLFEVLGVSQDADSNAVKVAYFKFAKSYHPDTVPAGAPEAIAKLKADVFARIGEAHRTLSDPKTKADYLSDLAHGGGEKVDVSKILAGEEYFQKGVILCRARKFADAVKMLSDAIASSDREGEYYVWRGWAKFFMYTDKKEGQAHALQDITLGLQKNPNVAAGYYFQGFMAKVLGDMATAKAFFSKTVQLDARHIDAQRELRMMK